MRRRRKSVAVQPEAAEMSPRGTQSESSTSTCSADAIHPAALGLDQCAAPVVPAARLRQGQFHTSRP